jgi:hypothetical protein
MRSLVVVAIGIPIGAALGQTSLYEEDLLASAPIRVEQ